MRCRGIRGAISVEANDAETILTATRELLEQIVAANRLRVEDVAGVIFSATPDLDAAYPARAAREMGWVSTPLLCMQEMATADGLPGCIRVLVMWNTDLPAGQVKSIYLGRARALRPDLEGAKSEGASNMAKVAFQGIAGAYSEEATRQFFGPQVEGVACQTLDDVFLAVESRQADYGMVPVENAVAGSVTQAYELLVEHDLRINAEVILRVRHMLLALPGTQRSDLKRVRSHPQALAQCERYLARHGLEPVPTFDTAGAAHELAENPDPASGAIASALAAELYGLQILDRHVEDLPFNYTRFFVLGLEDPPRAQRSKTSLVFTTRHQPGALYESLGEFARRNINLTKIESRPRRNQPWQYLFYLDFEGHWQDPECEAALMALLRRSSFVKLLGSYPAATTPVEDEL